MYALAAFSLMCVYVGVMSSTNEVSCSGAMVSVCVMCISGLEIL